MFNHDHDKMYVCDKYLENQWQKKLQIYHAKMDTSVCQFANGRSADSIEAKRASFPARSLVSFNTLKAGDNKAFYQLLQ